MNKYYDRLQNTIRNFSNFDDSQFNDLRSQDIVINNKEQAKKYIEEYSGDLPDVRVEVEDATGLFYNCVELFSIRNLYMREVIKANNMFSGCENLKQMPRYIETGNITSVKNMFRNCKSLTIAPMMDLKKCKDTRSMFMNCEKLTTIPSYEVKNVERASYMFAGCRKLAQIPPLNFRRINEIKSKNSVLGMFIGTLCAAAGAAVGSVGGMAGTMVGSSMGGAIGNVLGKNIGKDQENIVDADTGADTKQNLLYQGDKAITQEEYERIMRDRARDAQLNQ